MEKRELICIGCPMGCPLTVTLDGGAVVTVQVTIASFLLSSIIGLAFALMMVSNVRAVALFGISVVNALSTRVVVTVKRDGNEHRMTFADGFKATDLEVIGTVGKRNTGTSVRFNNDRAVTAGGAYNFGPVVVGGLFERSKRSTLSEDMTRNYWRVALMAPVGAHEFHLNVGVAGDYSGTSDTAGKQYTVAYNYNLSKRSKVYAYYTKIDNDSARSAGGGGAYSFLGSPAGLDISSVALGIRHNF